MKRTQQYILLLAGVLIGSPALRAQTAPQGITLGQATTEITGETLDIRFTIHASQIDLATDDQLKLEFAVETGDRRLILPAVIYAGGQRYRYEERRVALSGSFRIEPYHIYKGVKKRENHTLEYRLSIPYYTWMEHAAITYREYTHECSGDKRTSDGVLVADLNPMPVIVEPEIWKPDPELLPLLVNFIKPEVEQVKNRISMIELNIGFPVNVTAVRPEFANNTRELRRADSLIASLSGNELIHLNGVGIKGYASPEGRYATNERLAKGRSEGFKQYLIRNYPANRFIAGAATMWVAEDWEGLAHLVQASDIPNRDEVLSVVRDDAMAPDTKEQVLQKIGTWSNVYKVLLDEMFPKLRRIELRVDYTISKLDDGKARELLYTHPDMLSLDEIYRVALFYDPDSRQYREVYEIAARQYPDDVVANNNAAAAFLREGNFEAALPYLEKIKNDKNAGVNYGVYHYVTGDLDKAIEYFNRAKENGIEKGDQNLRLITGETNR